MLIDRVFVLAEPAPDGQHSTVIYAFSNGKFLYTPAVS